MDKEKQNLRIVVLLGITGIVFILGGILKILKFI